MSIPLVQEATKDAINTSIIAIKRNIERINMLLGLVDSGSPDLSGLATKQELEDAITQVETDLAPVDEVTSGNMQSVTSNAVSKAMSYSTEEHLTGRKWKNGKPTYEKYISLGKLPNNTTKYVAHHINNIDVNNIVKIEGLFTNGISTFQLPFRDTGASTCYLIVNATYIVVTDNTDLSSFDSYVDIEYTKTID